MSLRFLNPALLTTFRGYLPGMGISAVVTVAAMSLADHYHAPVMLFALLLGMAFLSSTLRGRSN